MEAQTREVTQPARRMVASFRTYAEAQRAVDHLADEQFPVECVAIVAEGLRFVEQVTGRLTYGRAALQGEVLTNWHVIQRASRIAVVFKPEEGVEVRKDLAFAATPIKVDPVADLALLQIKDPPPNLTALSFGELTNVQVGEDVHAIGHPSGEVWTYTTGVISAVRRDYHWQGPENLLHQATVIQTQTALNPGNSGGPLLNDRAEIIGVNSFRKEGEGLNYAVAIDTVRTFLQQAKRPLQPEERPAAPRAPSPGVSAYRMEPFGENIVGVYVDARVPPPDVWLVYRGAARQQPAYAAKGQATTTQIDTVVQAADPQWQVLVYYFDTDCDGVIDLVGYATGGDGTIDRYETPAQPLRIASLARELTEAFTQEANPYPQVCSCQ